MKVNFVQTLIAIATSLLVAYAFYAFHKGENALLLSCGSFIFLSTTLIIAIGINFNLPRTNVNIKAVAGIFCVIGLIDHIVFSFFDFSIPGYIISNGILLLLFILIIYSISKASQ
ncbi:MAG: hypothetical protein LBR26_10140 [Prevotella sp.]|jgi:hypothetical protein|nr:hypothetical protein [Prevotella sp.]